MSIAPSKPPPKAKPGETRGQRERFIAVCELVASGSHSVRKALEHEGLHNGEFYKLAKRDDELRALYEGALEDRHHAMFDKLEDEAEDLQAAVTTMAQGGISAGPVVSAFQQRLALAKFRAEKEAPKRYGQRMAVEHSGSIDLANAVLAARRRVGVEPEQPEGETS